MVELKPGWQERIAQQASKTLENLPASARPMRQRPNYVPPSQPKTGSTNTPSSR